MYDEEFVDYTIKALRKCKDHGFKIYMDPHQDVWSRFSGGDGAPYWTLLACGINPRHITATQSAIIHQEYPEPSNPDPQRLPAMIWGTNYSRMLSQTLFTLFFAGRDFAPKCILDGVNIQDWLEGHFIRSVGYLAKRMKEAGGILDECVIGWDSMNEPFEGYCGLPDLRATPHGQSLKKGSNPTPAQGVRLAYGQPQTVEWWDFGSFGPKRNGSVTIDPGGIKLWIDPDVADEPNGVSMRWGWKRDAGWKLGQCIWALHGVWDPPTGLFLRPDYFARPAADPTRPALFLADYWRPHWRRYVAAIREHHPEHIPFVQPPVFQPPPPLEDTDLQGRGCFSPHYYDGLTLMTRHWNWFNADALGVLRGKYSSPIFAVKVGEKAIRQSLREQLGVIKNDCLSIMGPYPTLMGEIGVPMDMDHKRAYGMDPSDSNGKGKGDYSQQTKALDASLNAADGVNGINWTVWTYAPDSCHLWGEGWNLEDLSLWSGDDMRGAVGPERQIPYMLPPSEEEVGNVKGGTTVTAVEVDGDGTDEEDTAEDAEERARIARNLKAALKVRDNASAAASTINLGRLLQPQPQGGKSLTVPEPPSMHIPAASTSTIALTDCLTTTLPPILTQAPPFATTNGFPLFNTPSNAFSFLINGARAYQAFTRPYPLATVGTPTFWEFDIAKAEFKLTVRVGREDIPYIDGKDAVSIEDVLHPTEIYLPIVQFARDEVIREAFGVPERVSKNVRHAKQSSVGTESTISVRVTDPQGRKTKGSSSVAGGSMISLNAPQKPFVAAGAVASSASSLALPDSSATLDDPFKDAYALEVTLPTGTSFSIENQLLKWYYPVPAAPAPSPLKNVDPNELSEEERKVAEDDGKIEYTLIIKRKGGGIDFGKVLGRRAVVKGGPEMRGLVEGGVGGRGKPGVADVVCGEGCIVA